MVRCGPPMASPHDTLLAYDYQFPKELVAQEPARPRDAARLLAYDRATGDVTLDTFAHLDEYLPERSVLVFNETKVIPARMTVTVDGKEIDLLCLREDGDRIRVLAPRAVQPGTSMAWAGHTLACVERDGK